MSIFKKLTFGGINSTDYNIYITGEAVYDAPERDVEMIQIPGRNGEFALDHGRFNNIEVEYPAGTFDSSQANFASSMASFRNAIASKVGYQRLEDDYNTDEYRMGVYKSGLDVSPVQYGEAGEFPLVFNCKPQRFLKSGETAVTVANNGTITNPTLFESKPLLQLYGSGTVTVNGTSLTLNNAALENIALADSFTYAHPTSVSKTISWSNSLLNTGDSITLYAPGLEWRIKAVTEARVYTVTPSASTKSNCTTSSENVSSVTGFGTTQTATAKLNDISFVKGTSKTASYSRSITVNFKDKTSTSYNLTWLAQATIAYNGSDQITFTVTSTLTNAKDSWSVNYNKVNSAGIDATSTVLSLGNNVYVDCDLGEVYRIENNQAVLLNQYVDIGSDLPVLSPGANTVTYDNTYTQVKITPRWWRI